LEQQAALERRVHKGTRASKGRRGVSAQPEIRAVKARKEIKARKEAPDRREGQDRRGHKGRRVRKATSTFRERNSTLPDRAQVYKTYSAYKLAYSLPAQPTKSLPTSGHKSLWEFKASNSVSSAVSPAQPSR
jgi:hypothetical protein